MWNIGCAPNNVSKWQMGFNSAFKGLILDVYVELKMFQAPPRPSSGAQKLQQQPLVLPLTLR